MQMNKMIIALILAFLVYTFLLPWIGVSGFLASILVTVGILALLKIAGLDWAFPWKIRGLYVAIILIVGFLFAGFFTADALSSLSASIMPGETITNPIGQSVTVGSGVAMQSCEAKAKSAGIDGKDANVVVNAWDKESNTPTSSAVDVNFCNIYLNGQFLQKTTDTSDLDVDNAAVGDTISIYCGGSSYYVDPVENFCVEKEDGNLINLMAHKIQTEVNLSLTVYDKTGSAALSSGTSGQEDYYITAGAGSDQKVFVYLQNNNNDAAYDFCAWATVAMTNVTSFQPTGSEYTQVVAAKSVKSIALLVNDTNTVTTDYAVYMRSQAVRLHEWDDLKDGFTIEIDDTNDPVATDGTGEDNAYAAVLSKDCTYSTADDLSSAYDYYTHDTSQDDVGLDETETSPLGGYDGAIIELR